MDPVFTLQESGTFQLSFDVLKELNTSGSVARRQVMLSGNYMLKMEGFEFNTAAVNCPTFATTALSAMITSPQIINTTTSSNRGFIVDLDQLTPVYASIPAAPVIVLYKAGAKVGDVLDHKVLCNFSGNALMIQLAFANSAGFNSALGYIPYDRSWSDIYKDGSGNPLTQPVYCTITFSYKKIF